MDLEDLEDIVIIDQRLGEGGFVSVFIYQLDGKNVAAKILSQLEKEISNLMNEAVRLTRLQYGKHIVYTYGFTMKDENLEDLVITDQRLGEGGFGSVFICQLDGKNVAAKILSQSEKEISNLVNEAARLKRLQYGKHIVYTYGFTMKDENLYMVMEYCEHGDLQKYLKKNKESVTYEQKILFCRGILLGLLYCHSMRIFHGDIKCENVILGKNLEPKLTDFGLSMTVDNIAYYSKLYKGSLYWAAPELFSIKEDEAVYPEFIADPYPCDVYSLGATFCEISCDGTTKFIDSDDPGTDIMLGLVSPIPKDAFLQEIVDRCCQFERNERISLDECLSMLDNVAEEKLSIPTIDDKWQRIQQDIQANSKLDPPPLFILHRHAENLVVGPSNLSLLEWLCINNCVDTVKNMIQPQKYDQDQIKWLYEISELCNSLEVVGFLQNMLHDNVGVPLVLLDRIDQHLWQFFEAFIKAGANCNQADLLDKAVERHYNKLVHFLFDTALSYRETVIHGAVKYGNAEAVRTLANRINLESKDENGDTPLLAAINAGNFEIVKILLDHKANVHNKNNRSRYISRVGGQHTPLYRAIVKGNHEIIELLINAGATIDTEDSKWHSLVQDLEQRGKSAIIQLISNAMRKGANEAEENHSTVTSISNNGGEGEESVEATPLLCTAIRNGQLDLVQKLIDDEVNVNEHDYKGYSPLYWAVIIGNEEIVRILLEAGANIDVMTPNNEKNFYAASSSNYFNGYTLLHIATVKRNLGIAKLLIESGANLSLRNEAGQTIMEMADNDDKKRIESIIQECVPVTKDSFQWILETMSMETVKTLISNRDASMDTLNHFLCIAAHHGNTEAIHYLLECGVNVNSKYEGKSSLEWAISGGSAQTVQALIDQGADIHSKGNEKNNSKSVITTSETWPSDKKDKVDEAQNLSDPPLHQAAALNNVKIVEVLLNAGADIDTRNKDGYNALYCAASHGCDEIVALLYKKGVKVTLWKKAEDFDSIYQIAKYILQKAAETGKINTESIFIDTGARVNFENMNNFILPLTVMQNENKMIADSSPSNNALSYENLDKIAALTEAVRNNQLGEVQSLLGAGADINAKNISGKTPLFECVDKSLIDIAQFLIEKGADVNARTELGHTPIHFAKNKEIVEILIAHGADINAKSTNGSTLLHNCVNESLIDIAQFMIEKGADVNARTEYGYTPIYFVKDKKIADILISHGADINAKSTNGVTPLHKCVDESLIDIAQFMIEKGADVNARTEHSHTPIHFAKDKGIAEILIAHGADINAKSANGLTPLYKFVDKSLIDTVQFLIEKGADVNARTEHGHTLIHYAKDKEIAEILIAHGANINTKTADGRTPLHECVNKSLIDMIQLLIEKGADVNAKTEHGHTPIHYAKDKGIAEFLISHDADINAKSTNGRTPLSECVDESLIDMVQFLIDKGTDVNARDNDGCAPIHYAKDKEIAEILIAHGADINAKSTNGRTPLHECVNESLIDIVQFLIEKGADVNAKDNDGCAPIHYAKDKEIAEILIAHGANINAKSMDGRTSLFICVYKSLIDMIQLLIEKGADVNTRIEYGHTPIHFAKDKGIAEILIAHGANINAKSMDGRTSLFICVNKSLIDMIQLLIEKGADVNARTEHGYTPIYFVKDKKIADILIAHGADINAKSTNGSTPLHKCVDESLIDMVQFLIEKGADVNARIEHGYTSIHYAKDKRIAEVLIAHSANINAKSRDGKTLFDILLEEQSKNLNSVIYKRKEVCELLEYLKNLK